MGGRPVGVLVVADVRLHREGLAEMLRRHDEVEVVGCAASAEEAARKVRERQPHAVLLDTRMRGSIAAVQTILAADPRASVLAFGVDGHDEEIVGHAEAGVAGYVGEDADARAVVDAVRSVGRGEHPCSPDVAAALLRRVSELAARPADPIDTHLTARQREIGELIARGLSNKEIARALFIEVATVKGHVHAMLERLQMRRREEIATAFRGIGAGPRVTRPGTRSRPADRV